MSRRPPSSGGGGGAILAGVLLAGLAGLALNANNPSRAAAAAPQPAPAELDAAAAVTCHHASHAGLTADQAVVATAVAGGESGHTDTATGDEDQTDSRWGPSIGRWQIRSLHADTGTGRPRDATRLRDPAFNAAAMHTISSGGGDWGAWGAYTNGSWRDHLPAARAACTQAGVA